jgi:hypothetical protein
MRSQLSRNLLSPLKHQTSGLQHCAEIKAFTSSCGETPGDSIRPRLMNRCILSLFYRLCLYAIPTISQSSFPPQTPNHPFPPCTDNMASAGLTGLWLELKKAPKKGIVGAARRAFVLVLIPTISQSSFPPQTPNHPFPPCTDILLLPVFVLDAQASARRAFVLVFEWGGLRVEDKNREKQNVGAGRKGMVWP